MFGTMVLWLRRRLVNASAVRAIREFGQTELAEFAAASALYGAAMFGGVVLDDVTGL